MSWRDLLTYWRSKHFGSKAPARRDIDPIAEIPHLAGSLFLIDVDDDRFRFRLIGSEIVRWAGRDSTGRLIDDQLMQKSDAEAWQAGLVKVSRQQVPLLAVNKPRDNSFAPLIAVVLPLIAEDGGTEMIFGGLFRIQDPRFRQTVDLLSIHGLVEYGIPDDLTDDVVLLPA